MGVMAKKKRNKAEAHADANGKPQSPPLEYLFRFVTPGLREQIQAYADRTHRSLNGAMNYLLETAVRRITLNDDDEPTSRHL